MWRSCEQGRSLNEGISLWYRRLDNRAASILNLTPVHANWNTEIHISAFESINCSVGTAHASFSDCAMVSKL